MLVLLRRVAGCFGRNTRQRKAEKRRRWTLGTKLRQNMHRMHV